MNILAFSESDLFLYSFAGWVLCALVGTAIGSTAGKKALGFALGSLLGPLGLILTAILCIGGKKTEPIIIYREPPAESLARRNTPAPAADFIPDHLTISRDGQVIGTWPLADVQDYLATGHLTGRDLFLHSNGQTWLPLTRIV